MRRLGQRFGVTRWAALLAGAAIVAGIVPGGAAVAAASTTANRPAESVDSALGGAHGPVNVIVQEWPDAGSSPERAVEQLGGQVTRDLSIIHGFAATLPGSEIGSLAATPGVRVISLDRS